MAQYGVLIYAHDSAHAPDATPEAIESCDEHSDELVESGVQLAAYALTPRELATSIRRDGTTDGPFTDSKEVVAGFYVIEAPDLDAALAIAATNPVVRDGGGVGSVRSTAATSHRATTATTRARTSPDRVSWRYGGGCDHGPF